jgi:hypothetical protein
MADISIQFHAMPEELHVFVRQILVDFDLHVVSLIYRPFAVSELSEAQLDECFSGQAPIKGFCFMIEFYFTIDVPILLSINELDFRKKNRDALRLNVGALGEDGLRESWMSARTENITALAVWKKIARRLKRITFPGATGVQPSTGATAPVKNHRFSEGAKRLDASGVSLLTITGIIMKP